MSNLDLSAVKKKIGEVEKSMQPGTVIDFSKTIKDLLEINKLLLVALEREAWRDKVGER